MLRGVQLDYLILRRNCSAPGVLQAPQSRLGSLYLGVSAHLCRAHKSPVHFFALRRATPKSFTIATVIASSTSSAGLLFIM